MLLFISCLFEEPELNTCQISPLLDHSFIQTDTKTGKEFTVLKFFPLSWGYSSVGSGLTLTVHISQGTCSA